MKTRRPIVKRSKTRRIAKLSRRLSHANTAITARYVAAASAITAADLRPILSHNNIAITERYAEVVA